MADVMIDKDVNIVKLLADQAAGRKVETDKAEEAAKEINKWLADFSPHNRYLVAQLIGYTVTRIQETAPNFLREIADEKNVGPQGKAAFNVPLGGIKAIIHAKGATVPRSKVAAKQITVDTVAVSARPSVNIVEVRSGQKNMADLIRSAYTAIELKKLAHIQQILADAVAGYGSPFYATGSGVVQATLDAQLLHYRRAGGVVMTGDFAILDKLSALAGFTPAGGAIQMSGNQIDEYNMNGFIGRYRGASVAPMMNAYAEDGETPLLDPSLIYIMASSGSKDQRNLKVVTEGPVFAHEETRIDDLSYDVRLDQHFGAAYIVGNTPTLGVYKDSTL